MKQKEYRKWLGHYKELHGCLKTLNFMNSKDYFKKVKNLYREIEVLDNNIYITDERINNLLVSKTEKEVKRVLSTYSLRHTNVRFYLTYNEHKIRLDLAFNTLKSVVVNTLAIIERILNKEENFSSINVKYYITHVVKMLKILCEENLKA